MKLNTIIKNNNIVGTKAQLKLIKQKITYQPRMLHTLIETVVYAKLFGHKPYVTADEILKNMQHSTQKGLRYFIIKSTTKGRQHAKR